MNFEEIKAIDNKNIMNTYPRYDIALVSGEGAIAYDVNGKKYIDFSSGIGVNSLGFADKQWAEAVADQANKLQHISNLYYSDVQAKLAETICNATGYSRVFFGNSGAEANECAIKLARKYSSLKYGVDRYNIITINNSFHGRTMATLSATAQPAMHMGFDPILSGFIYSAADESILNIPLKNVCAIMLEPIQGESGVIPIKKSFIELVSKLCVDNDIMLITDEVQCGIGRTGKLLAMEHYEIKADVVTLAKGLGGGLPIGACLVNEKYAGAFAVGDHGSTFGGNPVVCAGAQVVLDKINNEEFLYNIKENYELMHNSLIDIKNIKEIRGIGLMFGIDLAEGIVARDIVDKCLQNGLICLTAKNSLRLLPPLTIKKEQLEEGMTILKTVLESI